MDTFEEDIANEMNRDTLDDESYHKEIKAIWDETEKKVDELQAEQQVSTQTSFQRAKF